MLKAISLSVLFVVVFGAVSPLAQEPADTFMVYGAGATTCSVWTQHLTDKAQHPGDLQWVLGFVSAAGVFAGVRLKADANAIEPYITKYCQEHPTITITTAAANLVGTLR
jgi:hypothetical protein